MACSFIYRVRGCAVGVEEETGAVSRCKRECKCFFLRMLSVWHLFSLGGIFRSGGQRSGVGRNFKVGIYLSCAVFTLAPV